MQDTTGTVTVETIESLQATEADRLRAALIQIREVCDDNASASCNQAMALAFVRSVAADAISDTR